MLIMSLTSMGQSDLVILLIILICIASIVCPTKVVYRDPILISTLVEPDPPFDRSDSLIGFNPLSP